MEILDIIKKIHHTHILSFELWFQLSSSNCNTNCGYTTCKKNFKFYSNTQTYKKKNKWLSKVLLTKNTQHCNTIAFNILVKLNIWRKSGQQCRYFWVFDWKHNLTKTRNPKLIRLLLHSVLETSHVKFTSMVEYDKLKR